MGHPTWKHAIARILAICVVIAGLASKPIPATAYGRLPGWMMPCTFSHHNHDDPIVYPKQRGASHHHEFYGAVTTDAFSTERTLRHSDTSCKRLSDRSAYWHPTLLLRGSRVPAEGMMAYYLAPAKTDPATVRPVPQGLKIVAGDAHSDGPQPLGVVYFSCSGGAGAPHKALPFDCSRWRGTEVMAHIIFPACWDGVHLNSRDHKSHMAYPNKLKGCPKDHPVAIPKLTINVHWPIVDGTKATFSSGPAYTLHGDFFDAWDPLVMKQLVRDCIRAGKFCGVPER